MKIGDKIQCIRDYFDSDGVKLNRTGKEYTIISFNSFYHNESDIVIGITCESYEKNVFWIKYQKFGDSWDKIRKNNLIEDYFLYGNKLRKYKLEKLENVR